MRNKLEKQDKELASLIDKYNKLLEERCFTAFDLLAEELKELDYCSGLILTGSNGDFEFNAIKNENSNYETRINLTRILSKYDNFRGISISVYNKKDIDMQRSWRKIIKEVWF